MQKKYLSRWLVGIAGACLCLLAFGATAFAQSDTPADKIVVTDTLITSTLTSEPGLLIVAVENGSPAAKAGLVRGDILLKINDKLINTLTEVQAMLGVLQAGDGVTVTVQHGDETRNLKVTLGDRQGRPFLGIVPFVAGPGAPLAMPGLPVLPEAPNARLNITPTLRVLEVVKDSPAEKAGLQVGDTIVAINGKPLSPKVGLAGPIQAFAPGDVITLKIQRGADKQTIERKVTLGEQPDHSAQAFLGVKVAPARIIIINKKFVGPGPGDDLPYVVPPPYLGWWMPLPYYGMPPMLVIPYGNGFGQPVPDMNGGNNEEDFLMASPGAPYDGQRLFYYKMPFSFMPPSSAPAQIELSQDPAI